MPMSEISFSHGQPKVFHLASGISRGIDAHFLLLEVPERESEKRERERERETNNGCTSSRERKKWKRPTNETCIRSFLFRLQLRSAKRSF